MARKKLGRPSKYKREFCQKLIDHMEKGFSFESFGAVIDVSVSNMNVWVTRYPEFQAAKDLAYNKSRLFWEKVGIDNLHTTVIRKGNMTVTKSLNVRVWELNLKTKFKEWRNVDKVDQPTDKSETPQLIINVKQSG